MVKNRHQLVAWDKTLNLLWTWHSRLRRYQVTKKKAEAKRKKSFVLKVTTTTHGAEVGHHMTKVGESWAAHFVADMLMWNRTNGKEKNLSENLVLSKSVPCQTEKSLFSFFFFSLFAPHEKISIRPESSNILKETTTRPIDVLCKNVALSHTFRHQWDFFVKIIKKRTHNFSACHGLMIAIIKKSTTLETKMKSSTISRERTSADYMINENWHSTEAKKSFSSLSLHLVHEKF